MIIKNIDGIYDTLRVINYFIKRGNIELAYQCMTKEAAFVISCVAKYQNEMKQLADRWVKENEHN